MAILASFLHELGETLDRAFPHDGSVLDCDQDGEDLRWTLITGLKSPTPNEVYGMSIGTMEIGIASIDTIPFFCFRLLLKDGPFGQILLPWQECPFNPAWVGFKDLWQDSPDSMVIEYYGVELPSKEIITRRVFKLPNPMSKKWYSFCRKFTYGAPFEVRVSKIYDQHPHVGAIAELASHRCYVA